MVLVRTIIKIAVSSGEQGHRSNSSSNSSNNKENHNQLSPSKKIRSLLAIKVKANFAWAIQTRLSIIVS